jgi:NTP pyrophosphatase (non-canonical NTP hydrolase)
MHSFAEYEEAALGMAIYPGQGGPLGLSYVALKGAGEAGEFAEHVGKAIRDDKFGQPIYRQVDYDRLNERPVLVPTGETVELTPERRALLRKEVGDQLWYLAAKARELGTNLSEIAAENIDKLRDRKERGVLGGSGDNR